MCRIYGKFFAVCGHRSFNGEPCALYPNCKYFGSAIDFPDTLCSYCDRDTSIGRTVIFGPNSYWIQSQADLSRRVGPYLKWKELCLAKDRFTKLDSAVVLSTLAKLNLLLREYKTADLEDGDPLVRQAFGMKDKEDLILCLNQMFGYEHDPDRPEYSLKQVIDPPYRYNIEQLTTFLLFLPRLTAIDAVFLEVERIEPVPLKAQADCDDDCPICTKEFDAENIAVQLRPCGHTFCEPCVHEWFRQNRSCPICRRRYYSEKLMKDLSGQQNHNRPRIDLAL